MLVTDGSDGTPAGIWYRQSWLDTFMRCSERGRLAIVKPEFDKRSGDAAALGTGAHKGAEVILLGGSISEAHDAIAAEIVAEAHDPGIQFKTYGKIEELIVVAIACFDAWLGELYPWVKENGWHINPRPEMKFKVPLYELEDGTTVGITGTADLPTDDNAVVDWKTSAREYKPWEKQRYAIQPSTYGAAGVLGGFAPLEFAWPVQFYYGIMIRPSKVGGKASTQIIPIERTEAHAKWMLKQIKTALWMAQTDLSTPWPTTETDWLCSEKWCPWHSICRGAIISPSDDTVVKMSDRRPMAA